MKIPRKDLEMWAGAQMRASVELKAKSGDSWRTDLEFSDLEQAFKHILEMDIEVFERALFVSAVGTGGFLYWTSLDPTTFNSSVLDLLPSLSPQ